MHACFSFPQSGTPKWGVQYKRGLNPALTVLDTSRNIGARCHVLCRTCGPKGRENRATFVKNVAFCDGVSRIASAPGGSSTHNTTTWGYPWCQIGRFALVGSNRWSRKCQRHTATQTLRPMAQWPQAYLVTILGGYVLVRQEMTSNQKTQARIFYKLVLQGISGAGFNRERKFSPKLFWPKFLEVP